MQYKFCPHCFCREFENFCKMSGFNVAEYQSPPGTLAPGVEISDANTGNKYLIGRVIGKGGFGITYTGFDAKKNVRYAIKEYMPSGISKREESGRISVPNPDDVEAYESGLIALMEEVNTLIKLRGTPAIVKSYDFITANNTGYMVMEFLDGVSLKKLLDVNGGLEVDFALKAVLDVANALRTVHAYGIIHRDISPENIMLVGNDNIRLIDFGASKYSVIGLIKDMTPVVKRGYAPPEQYFTDGVQGGWTDVYALGATFYKLITGITLPDALKREENDTVEPLHYKYPQVSRPLSEVIYKAVSLKHRNRYLTVEEFSKALKAAYPGFGTKYISSDSDTENADETQSTNQRYRDKVVQKSTSSKKSIWADIFGTKKKKYSRPIPYVRVIYGQGDSAEYPILENKDELVGRDSEKCRIVVPESTVSRIHCSVRFNTAKGLFVINDKSTHGIYENDAKTRLRQHSDYTFPPGTKLMLATKNIIIELGVKQ